MPLAYSRVLLAMAGLLELGAATAFLIAIVHEPRCCFYTRFVSQYAEPSMLDDVAWGSVALVLGLAGLIPLLVIVFQPGTRRRLAHAARAAGRRSNPLLTIERKLESL